MNRKFSIENQESLQNTNDSNPMLYNGGSMNNLGEISQQNN